MPLITQLLLEALGLSREISTFGFVFGTFPTAPSVFVFSALFHCGLNLVCTQMLHHCTVTYYTLLLKCNIALAQGKLIVSAKIC